uniref:DRBM domain-containing protein n=1 Tax=Anopheles farauti TaxID=69004 RepID=A0A182QKI6_9DIPT
MQVQVLQNTIDQMMGEPLAADSGAVCESNNTNKDGASTSRANLNKERYISKKPLNATERKKSEKERKARQLRRLRKWLMPKNAIVALHELQGPGMAEFTLNTNGHETKAEIVINNVKYEATAPNKNLAKAKASEKALRDLAFSQMIRVRQQRAALGQQRQQQAVADGDNTIGTDSNTDKVDGSDNDMETDDRIAAEDLPMEHLASFALHKLFTDWEAEGFEMRPQIAYEDLGVNDNQVNKEFIAGLTVDGQHFVGKGRSKKLARKAAAIDACKALFGVEFDKSVLING